LVTVPSRSWIPLPPLCLYTFILFFLECTNIKDGAQPVHVAHPPIIIVVAEFLLIFFLFLAHCCFTV
jgi:hypothetical protein